MEIDIGFTGWWLKGAATELRVSQFAFKEEAFQSYQEFSKDMVVWASPNLENMPPSGRFNQAGVVGDGLAVVAFPFPCCCSYTGASFF